MNITTNLFRGLILFGMIAGMVACSSSPAPWSRPSDSPWSDKRAAADDIPEPVVDEPVMEPEPMTPGDDWSYPPPGEDSGRPSAMGAAAMPEPAPAPEPEPVMLDSPEDEIMALPTSYYAVQIYASSTEKSMQSFQEKFGLEDLKAVRTVRGGGEIIHVLVSVQPDRAAADAEAASLQAKTGQKPWVRSVAGLQKIVAN